MIVQRTKTYAVCPTCGKDAGQVDHLLGKKTRTWWYCDHCGHRYGLEFFADGTVNITADKGRKITTIDVLKLAPQSKPVYFVVEGMRFEGDGNGHDTQEEMLEHKRFYYEEHSCPTNWLEPVMMYFDRDADPHGVIEFVTTRDDSEFPPDESHGPNNRDFALIALIEKHHEPPLPEEPQ